MLFWCTFNLHRYTAAHSDTIMQTWGAFDGKYLIVCWVPSHKYPSPPMRRPWTLEAPFRRPIMTTSAQAQTTMLSCFRSLKYSTVLPWRAWMDHSWKVRRVQKTIYMMPICIADKMCGVCMHVYITAISMSLTNANFAKRIQPDSLYQWALLDEQCM